VRRDVKPSAAGDDFSFLIQDKPGAYVWIGDGRAGKDGDLRNARHDFNDAILPASVSWMSTVAKLALAA
jgi:hippurate hydrolase